MDIKRKDSFVFHDEWWEQYFELMNVTERGELITQIYEYHINGKIPQIEKGDRFRESMWKRIVKHIDYDIQKYNDRCLKNHESQMKRWNKKQDTNEYNRIQTNTIVTDNVTVTETETEKDNVNAINEKTPSRGQTIDVQYLIDRYNSFNENCIDIAGTNNPVNVGLINADCDRLRKAKEILGAYDKQQIDNVFDICETSPYLSGQLEIRPRKASFVYILDNFKRIYEGEIGNDANWNYPELSGQYEETDD